MNKTHTTYVVMVLVLSGGLWGILRAGSHLRAARNVAGEWQVKWGQAGSRPEDRMTLSQSGRFLNATLHGPDKSRGVQLRGRLEGKGGDSGRKVVLRAVASDFTMTAMLDETGQLLLGNADTGAPVEWQANRINPASAAH